MPKKSVKNTKDAKTYISVLFKSAISFISELAILPKITLLYSQSIYAAAKTTPKLAKTATRIFI